MAKRKLYEMGSDAVFAISRSKIENYVQCPRCFVLDRRDGTAAPTGPSFTLNSAVDSLLKKEFDRHREAGTVHPVLQQLGVNLIPLKDSNMDVWRENFKGVRYLHEETKLEVFGAVDDLWVNEIGEIVVIDYKSTAKATPVEELGDEKWHHAYRRQIEVYQWLLRHLGYKVSKTGYWLYETARNTADSFEQKLDFDARLISHEGDTSWVEPILFDIKRDLENFELVESGENCEMCKFFDARTRLYKAYDLEVAPLCEHCKKPMKPIIYGMPSPDSYDRLKDTHVFGGCTISPFDHQWACKECGTNAF
ncbi:MAG: hypothetical protein RLZZ164_1108 [Actinomycetota bacterium]